MFREADPNMSEASWAIRFAASLPNVKMVLSGMSSMDMMLDNTSYMKDFKPLTKEETEMCLKAAEIINKGIAIPCTGCAYCVDGCPMNIPVPKYFSLYNAEKIEKEGQPFTPQQEYYDRLTANFGKASDCVECGQCEEACPQHLQIRDYLKQVAGHFE